MKIKEYRIRKGMTVDELARRLGVTQQAVSNWENGMRSPKPVMIVRLAQELECTPNDLLGYVMPVEANA